MPANIPEISITAAQQPGSVTFDNFPQLRGQLQQVHDRFMAIHYRVGELEDAKQDLAALRKAKRTLTSAKKALKEGYTAPFAQVEAQLDELIALLKEPEDRVNAHVKEIEREAKRIYIEEFSASYATDLGEHAAHVLSSPAFFNPRWMNVSYKTRDWQADVVQIIDRAADDISDILMRDDDVRQALLARYYETLDMRGVERFENTLRRQMQPHPVMQEPSPQPPKSAEAPAAEAPPAEAPAAEAPPAEQRYYMELTVKGTAEQMRALLAYLAEANIPYDRGTSGKLPKR